MTRLWWKWQNCLENVLGNGLSTAKPIIVQVFHKESWNENKKFMNEAFQDVFVLFEI